MNTTVSVIIPTRGRPSQLILAVRSVLAQSLEPAESLEVIVVVDGPDEATEAALADITDPRVRTIRLSRQRGHASARNTGIEAARGLWCAFLDDDDAWFPDKVTAQLRTARQAHTEGIAHPVVGCVVRARSEGAVMLWPVRTPNEFEPIADYLYARSGWSSVLTGHTLMQTSMILLPAQLARHVRFRGGMRRHADPDWLLRLQAESGVRFLFPETDQPLAEWNLTGTGRISSSGDYRYSIVWARRHARQLGPRAIAGFLTGPAAHVACQIPSKVARRRAFAALLREAIDSGDATVWDLAALAVKYLGLQSRRRGHAPRRAPEAAP